jgi:phenylacetate-coenzyme A ligase PaaK-like adenylate-forming protein
MTQRLPPYDPWMTAGVACDVAMATTAPTATIEARAQRRLVALLQTAIRRSPLFRRMLEGRDCTRVRLADLPSTRKTELMAAFDDWIGDPEVDRGSLRRHLDDRAQIAEPYLDRYVVWESSGSSGEPAVFLEDAQAMAVYDALEALRRPALRDPLHWLDPWNVGGSTVFVGATDGHFASNVALERLRRLNPVLRERLSAVSFLQPLEELCRVLEKLAPTVIATYPTQAVLLAEEHAAGRLRIAPREVWTGGETLTRAMRRMVERAFSCRVVNSYGSSEFLALATDCPAGRLHLNADWAILEPVDANGLPVERGTAGTTTLLTNLANRVQPLLRYDLGDRVLVDATPCECGSPLPAIEVEGRADDVLRLPGEDGRIVTLVPLALATVLEEDAGLFDFQLVQRGPSRLELRSGLRTASAQPAMRRARAVLEQFLACQGARAAAIECHPGEPVVVGRSGKIPRIVADPAARRRSRDPAP